MRLGLLLSSLFHAVIILTGVIALPMPEKFEVEQARALPVDILTVAEFTKLKQKTEKPEPVKKKKPVPVRKLTKLETKPVPEPAPVPKPAPPKAATPPPPPPKPEVKKAEPKPEPKPELKPEPKPEPKKPEVKKPEQVVAAVPVPRRKPRPPVPKKPERIFNPDKIAALLNKMPGAESAPDKPNEISDTGAATGRDNQLTISELDALRAQISRCWNPPIGVEAAENLVIRLKLRLKRDGSLAGPPVIANSGSDLLFQVAAESAIRAVKRCQPYELPAGKYESWRDVHLNFDPREMFGG